MDSKRPMTPRSAYQAYLKGDLSPAQAERAVQNWYSAQAPQPKPKGRD